MQKHVGSSKRFYGDELRRSVSRRRNAVFACARTRVSTVGFVTKRVSSHFDGVERLRREQSITTRLYFHIVYFPLTAGSNNLV